MQMLPKFLQDLTCILCRHWTDGLDCDVMRVQCGPRGASGSFLFYSRRGLRSRQAVVQSRAHRVDRQFRAVLAVQGQPEVELGGARPAPTGAGPRNAVLGWTGRGEGVLP